MAEMWNRVNIPFPGAVSTVRIHFRPSTDVKVKTLLAQNERVLKLLRSEILQTEVRVLYELLYILNNSFKGNKTFKGLKQVEQCVNRLKSMKLDVALQDLTELCPNRIQRGLSIKAGECDVPSQPSLEWLCLKVLGAAQLMSCTLNRCCRAFSLSKQQMKWEEFVILNVVITSMLCRLWVIFRGVLFSLSTLYQQLLELLREVAAAKPMPFLTDFTLPADVTQFLPSDAFGLTKHLANITHTKDPKAKQQNKKKPPINVKNQGRTRKIKEDLGVTIEREIVLDTDLKPFVNVFKNFTQAKSFQQKDHQANERQKFKKQLREASTFTDMETCLEDMIQWCKSKRMRKEKCLLTFMRLKCQRMKCMEAAGYNVQRKLLNFRQEACRASSFHGSEPRTSRLPAARRTLDHRKTRFHSLRNHFKFSAVRAAVKQKKLRKRTDKAVSRQSRDNQRNGTRHKAALQTTDRENDNHDDIDDIFAAVGL